MSQKSAIKIEILVLAYNRSALISATLESLLAQTLPASRICVLDNGSTDNTALIVQSFATRGVELVRRESNNPRLCWTELQDMARGPWTMLFHDDDLLHPDYLRDASTALANEPGATIAVSAMRVHQNPERMAWGKISGKHYTILSGRQLAAYIFGGFAMPFCSVIYRVDVLKQGYFNMETYGKIVDRPFVIDAALAGRAVVMLDPYVKYRVHAKQDSRDQLSGPFLPEIFALQRYYRNLLGEHLTDYPGRIFLRRNYRNLLGEFNRLNRNMHTPMTHEIFFKNAIEAGATSIKSLRFGKYYAKITDIPRKIEKIIKTFIR